jgi:hypothetical protein
MDRETSAHRNVAVCAFGLLKISELTGSIFEAETVYEIMFNSDFSVWIQEEGAMQLLSGFALRKAHYRPDLK